MTDDSSSHAERFHRLHPLTPLGRGWKAVAVVYAVAVGDNVRNANLAGVAAVTVVVGAIALVSGLFSWWFTRYGIDGDNLVVDSGVLFRRSRRLPLARLQAVDVVRPLIARVLGLAELRLEVAGGADSDAPLAYLTESDAHRLRAELLARAAGLDAATPEAPEQVLVEVPAGLLAASIVLDSVFLIGVGVLVALGTVSAVTDQVSVLGLGIPVTLGLAGVLYQGFIQNFGFTVADSPDGLRLRRGLLETRAQTVPPGRVQGVELQQPLLWRSLGWWRLQVTVAGYTQDWQSDHASTLLPVASYPDALHLLRFAVPGVDLDAVQRAPVPRRAFWRAPVQARRLAAGADERVFVVHYGVLRRRVAVVPHERCQSARITQGPWQRWLRLATVHVDIAPGPVQATARHRDVWEARRILEEEVVRSRRARAADRSERWMSSHE